MKGRIDESLHKLLGATPALNTLTQVSEHWMHTMPEPLSIQEPWNRISPSEFLRDKSCKTAITPAVLRALRAAESPEGSFQKLLAP